MFRIIFTTLAFLGALFQTVVTKTPPVEALLFNFILFDIGFWGIFAFMDHYFRFDKNATKLYRQQGGLLQKTIVFSNLFRGVLGILCIWIGGAFWSLTVIISSAIIFVQGCYELKHTEKMAASNNKLYYYAEFVVSFDLLFPLALVGLLVVCKMGM